MGAKAGWMVLAAGVLFGCGRVEQGASQPPPNACQSNVCARAGACGTMLDGCGGTATCGDCASGQTCGGGGHPNACGVGTCAPVSCAQQGKNCGLITDGCSQVLDCGTCPSGYHCGDDAEPNVCIPNPAPPSRP